MGRRRACVPHVIMLSAGGSGLSRADDELEGEAGGEWLRMCSTGVLGTACPETSGFTSTFSSLKLHSGTRGSPLIGLMGSRFRVCSTSRNGLGGVTNGGAEQ